MLERSEASVTLLNMTDSSVDFISLRMTLISAIIKKSPPLYGGDKGNLFVDIKIVRDFNPALLTTNC